MPKARKDENFIGYMFQEIEDTISTTFDSETSYAVGDYCIYNDTLYICTTAHTGAWNASDFAATTVSDELKNTGGGGGGDGVDKSDLSSIMQTGTTASQIINSGTFFYLNNILVKAKTNIMKNATFTQGTNYTIVSQGQGGLNELPAAIGYALDCNYIKFVNGLLIQWGLLTGTDAARTVTLPVSYKDSYYSVFTQYLSPNSPNPTNAYFTTVQLMDVNKFKINKYVGSSSDKYAFFTIGFWK